MVIRRLRSRHQPVDEGHRLGEPVEREYLHERVALEPHRGQLAVDVGLDVGIDGAVVVVQRMAGGQVLLGVADGDDRQRQRRVPALGLRAGTGLRGEAGAPRGGSRQRDHSSEHFSPAAAFW